MRQLFLRTYAILSAVVLAGLVVAWAWHAAQRAAPDASVEALLAASDEVRQAFDAPDLPPEAAARRVEADLGVDVDVMPLDPLPPLHPHVRARLHRGLSAGPVPGRFPELWVPLPQRGLLVHVRPRRAPPPPVPWIAAAVLLGLGVAVATQLLPLDRDLERLSDAARAFGEGDRAARSGVRAGAVAELGARFDAMADRIAGLLDAQHELMLAVSHEIRTPLNRLRFAVELLASEDDSDARAGSLDAIQGDLDDLDALVGELLTWSSLRAGAPVARSTVALAELVAEVVGGLARGRPQLAVRVEVPEGLAVRADPLLLRRAIGNLAANAARHAASRVEVTAEVAGGGVEIRVDDDGPGIPEADRERVLEPFVRLDAARARDAGGVGMGLALASRIARSHGGTLTVGESPAGGARLALSLPGSLTEADTG